MREDNIQKLQEILQEIDKIPFSKETQEKELEYLEHVGILKAQGYDGFGSFISSYNSLQLRRDWEVPEEVFQKLVFSRNNEVSNKILVGNLLDDILSSLVEVPYLEVLTKQDQVYGLLVARMSFEGYAIAEGYAEIYNRYQSNRRIEARSKVRKEIVHEEKNRGEFHWVLDLILPK